MNQKKNGFQTSTFHFLKCVQRYLMAIRTNFTRVANSYDLTHTIFCFCFYCNTKTQSSTVAERAQRAANRKNTCKNAHAANAQCCVEHLQCVSLFVCVVSICTICCQNYDFFFLICWCFFYLHVFSEVAAR